MSQASAMSQLHGHECTILSGISRPVIPSEIQWLGEPGPRDTLLKLETYGGGEDVGVGFWVLLRATN